MSELTATSDRFIARHGATRSLGEFTGDANAGFSRGETVLLRTERGQELGELLCPSTPGAFAQIKDPTQGQIIRKLNAEDIARQEKLKLEQVREYDVSRKLVADRRLQMEIVDVEHLFGGERIVFYFLAEKRVDFRELVKDMAREFHTRIELRQIGVRDEAKLKADFGDCGKPVCCNTHMAVMPPVSMRMAKLQKSTLDPTKISGRCGRLKCCLRFEQDVYEEFVRELPPVGCRVVTKNGNGRVLAQEILAKRLLVEFEDGRRLPIPAADVVSRI